MPNEQQGNSEPQSEQGESGSPKPLSNEDLNRAITARLKEYDKKMKDTLTETIKSTLGGLDASIASKLEELVLAKMDPPKETKKVANVDDHPAFLAMKREHAELKSAIETEKQQRAAAESQIRDGKLRQTLASELAKLGISDPVRQNIAIGHLVDASKKVRYSEDDPGSLIFRGENGDEWDLSSGMKEWSKSDEAKYLIPARGVQGSGERPTQGAKAPSKDGKVTRGEVADQLSEFLKGQIGR